jgi:hypothetical protein
MYVLVVYIPTNNVKAVVQRMADKGAGSIGNYRACSFQQCGKGSFEPMAGAIPFIGTVGLLEEVEEVRVEMVCTAEHIKSVLTHMIALHPYEEVPYHVIEAKELSDFID